MFGTDWPKFKYFFTCGGGFFCCFWITSEKDVHDEIFWDSCEETPTTITTYILQKKTTNNKTCFYKNMRKNLWEKGSKKENNSLWQVSSKKTKKDLLTTYSQKCEQNQQTIHPPKQLFIIFTIRLFGKSGQRRRGAL